MKLRILGLITLLSMSIQNLYAGTGQAGCIFLIIYPGARQVGMGNTGVALADDALAT